MPSLRLLAGAFVSALIAASIACQRPAPIALDLAAVAPLAEHEAKWDLVVFGAPAAEAHQGPGFIWTAGEGGQPDHACAAAQAEVVFKWATAAARVVIVDMAPYAGLRGQSADVFLNERSVGRIVLDDARRRYAVSLPPQVQQPGRNVLAFTFAVGAAPQKPHRLRLAAAFYALAIGPTAEPALLDLAAKGAPAPLAIETIAGAPVLTQVGTSTLRFAFRAPEKAELRAAPDLHRLAREAGGQATFRVTLEEDSKPERELWSGTIGGREGPPGPLRLPLGVGRGTIVRLGLHVSGSRFAWGVWSAPRIEGRGETMWPLTDPARETSPSPDPRAEALRRSLAGANVMLVIVDAAGARHFSSYGYSRQTTPEIDRIAREGIVFEDAHSPVGFTLLALSSLWTGQLPDQHHNGVPYNSRLHAGATTLAEVLSTKRIHTAGFVDNVFAGSAYGLDQGFAEFDEIYRRFPKAGAEIFREVMTPWLAANRSRRFFAYLHYREPHFPYNPRPPFNTLFGPDGSLPREARTELTWLTDVNWKRRKPSDAEIDNLVRLYDGNLRYVDGEVAALRKVLEDAGLWDRTVVIITADHGEALYEHGFIGHLNQVYEDVTHIPLIVHLPRGVGPAGTRVKGLVDLTDLTSTVADVFGTSAPSFRGRSLLPILAGAPAKEALVARTAEDQPKYAVRHGHFALVYHTARGDAELYDLATDSGQQRNIASDQPVRASFYRQALFRFLIEARHGPRAVAEEVRLTEEQKENLKALGYVH